MSVAVKLTLKDRRLLANLGRPKPRIATPYTDRLQLDRIIAREIKRTADAELIALGMKPTEQPSTRKPALTGATAAKAAFTKALASVGAARFGIAVGYIFAGALAAWVAMQPVIDEADRARTVAEQNAHDAASKAIGHTTVQLSGRPEDVARYSAAIAADLKQGLKR